MSGQLDTRRIEASLDFLEGLSFIHMRMTGDDPEMLCIRGYRTYWHDDWLTQEFHIDAHVTSGYVHSEAQWTEYGRFEELTYVRESLPSGAVLGILETCGWFPTLDEEMENAQQVYTLVGDAGMRFGGDTLFNSFEYLV